MVGTSNKGAGPHRSADVLLLTDFDGDGFLPLAKQM